MSGLVAGYPWYSSLWFRDIGWMLPAVLWLGDVDRVVASLATAFRYQAPRTSRSSGRPRGEIPMQLSPGPDLPLRDLRYYALLSRNRAPPDHGTPGTSAAPYRYRAGPGADPRRGDSTTSTPGTGSSPTAGKSTAMEGAVARGRPRPIRDRRLRYDDLGLGRPAGPRDRPSGPLGRVRSMRSPSSASSVGGTGRRGPPGARGAGSQIGVPRPGTGGARKQYLYDSVRAGRLAAARFSDRTRCGRSRPGSLDDCDVPFDLRAG